MKSFINPFRTESNKEKGINKIEYYTYIPEEPIYKIGDYAIYQNHKLSYIYTYKQLAFNELAGKNIEHLANVANRTEPINQQSLFLYNRAIETLNNNLNLLK